MHNQVKCRKVNKKRIISDGDISHADRQMLVSLAFNEINAESERDTRPAWVTVVVRTPLMSRELLCSHPSDG